MHSIFWQSLEIILGIQFLFWGLNGFFQWIAPPENDMHFGNFVKAAYKIKFLMTSVKLIQIVAGVLLLAQFKVVAGILLLAPIVFVISLLQIFHAKNPWPVLIPICLPFIAVFFNHALPWVLINS